jgi:hypothetical protein
MAADMKDGVEQGKVLVIGGGRFGCLAVERLGGRVSLVIEPHPSPELSALGVPVKAEPGEIAGPRILAASSAQTWVVPAVPRHFLGDWLQAMLSPVKINTVFPPEACVPQAPSIMQGKRGEIYLSLADFMCPDDCPEPAEICTVTGQPRGEPMFARLAAIACPQWHTGVLRSRQLAPGVGGLKLAEMRDLKNKIVNKGGSWLIGTACRCHGVLQGLIMDRAGEGAGCLI